MIASLRSFVFSSSLAFNYLQIIQAHQQSLQKAARRSYEERKKKKKNFFQENQEQEACWGPVGPLEDCSIKRDPGEDEIIPS